MMIDVIVPETVNPVRTGMTLPRPNSWMMRDTSGSRVRAGMTLVEMAIAVAILAVCITAGIQAFRIYRGKMAENLPQRLMLQMEARRALVNLYRVLQDGIEIVSPVPGTTLPYLVFKDTRNNICVVFLEEDAAQTRLLKRPVYKAKMVVRDPTGGVVGKPQLLMEHVVKLNFTSYNHGAVFLSTQLFGGGKDFSLVNFVRLQNATTEIGR